MAQNLTNFDAMLKEFYPKDVILDLVKQKQEAIINGTFRVDINEAAPPSGQ